MKENGLIKKLATEYGDFIRYAEINGNTYCDITDYEREQSHRKKIKALYYRGLSTIEKYNTCDANQTKDMFEDAIFCDFDQLDWETEDKNSIIASLERISPNRILDEQFRTYEVYHNGETKYTTPFEYDAISTIMKHASELTEEQFIEWVYNSDQHGLYGEIYQDDMVLDWVLLTDTDEGFITFRVYKGVKLSGEILLGEGVGAKYLYCEDIPFKKDSNISNNEDFVLYARDTYFGGSIRYVICDGYRFYSQEDWEKYYECLHMELIKCSDDVTRHELFQRIQQWEKNHLRLNKVADEMFSLFDGINWKRWSKKRIRTALRENASMGCNDELRYYLDRSYSHPTYTLNNILDADRINKARKSGFLAFLEKSGMTQKDTTPNIGDPRLCFIFNYGTINGWFFISKNNLINLAFKLSCALDRGIDPNTCLEKNEDSMFEVCLDNNVIEREYR